MIVGEESVRTVRPVRPVRQAHRPRVTGRSSMSKVEHKAPSTEYVEVSRSRGLEVRKCKNLLLSLNTI